MKASIVCATYLESNQKYLDLLIKSIRNLDFDKNELEVIIVSSGEYKPNTYEFKNVHSPFRLHFPSAINLGVEHASGDNLLIVNDDVILTQHCLNAFYQFGSDREIILGPISNCDNYFKYHLPFLYTHNNQYMSVDKRFYRYDDWPHPEDMMNAHPLCGPGVWFQEYICFYTVFMSKKVWNKLGPLDHEYKTGQDDLDYCKRAKLEKIPVGIVSNALVWHFGGVASSQTLTTEERKFNIDKYFKKWNELPK